MIGLGLGHGRNTVHQCVPSVHLGCFFCWLIILPLKTVGRCHCLLEVIVHDAELGVKRVIVLQQNSELKSGTWLALVY